MCKKYVYQNEDTGEVIVLSEIASARFFDNRDPRDWVFLEIRDEKTVDKNSETT